MTVTNGFQQLNECCQRPNLGKHLVESGNPIYFRLPVKPPHGYHLLPRFSSEPGDKSQPLNRIGCLLLLLLSSHYPLIYSWCALTYLEFYSIVPANLQSHCMRPKWPIGLSPRNVPWLCPDIWPSLARQRWAHFTPVKVSHLLTWTNPYVVTASLLAVYLDFTAFHPTMRWKPE